VRVQQPEEREVPEGAERCQVQRARLDVAAGERWNEKERESQPRSQHQQHAARHGRADEPQHADREREQRHERHAPAVASGQALRRGVRDQRAHRLGGRRMDCGATQGPRSTWSLTSVQARRSR
jgi:hypothetical protein